LETANNLRSNITHTFLALLFSALIVAFEAKAQDSTETLLTTDNAYNPIPSPDGRYIAYVRTGWGEKSWFGLGRASLVSQVKLMTVRGDAAQRTLADDYFLSDWTPDSTRLVCYRDGNYVLVSTQGKRTLAGRIPNDPDHLGEAEWVAYSSFLKTIIWSRQFDKSHRAIETPTRTIVKDRKLWQERVVPSPDGRYLAVFREESQTDLRVYDLRLKSWTDLGRMSIHPDKDWWYIQPNWSPWFADSSRLVFLRDSTLVIIRPDGTQNMETKVDDHAGLPVASPDGQSIAYVTFEPRPMKQRPDLQFWGGTTIWVVPASAGSAPCPVTQKNQDEVYDLKWLSDETLVFDRVADEMFYGHARIWKAAVLR
jgi:Tol biopolymer transport system component